MKKKKKRKDILKKTTVKITVVYLSKKAFFLKNKKKGKMSDTVLLPRYAYVLISFLSLQFSICFLFLSTNTYQGKFSSPLEKRKRIMLLSTTETR